jgi:hypothetical protein
MISPSRIVQLNRATNNKNEIFANFFMIVKIFQGIFFNLYFCNAFTVSSPIQLIENDLPKIKCMDYFMPPHFTDNQLERQ